MNGIDTTQDCTPHIAQLKAAGITFVCRYMSHSAWKNMTDAEVDALSKAGLYIVSVWESAGDHPSFFSYSQGLTDGAGAFAFAQSLGQPFSAPIYFAVDYDANPVPEIHEYFRGVRESLQRHGQIGVGAYNVGVYGSGAVCAYLKGEGFVSFTWLAQSPGWAGSDTYTDWNIKQLPSGTLAGMAVDMDESSPKGGGGWKAA